MNSDQLLGVLQQQLCNEHHCNYYHCLNPLCHTANKRHISPAAHLKCLKRAVRTQWVTATPQYMQHLWKHISYWHAQQHIQ